MSPRNKIERAIHYTSRTTASSCLVILLCVYTFGAWLRHGAQDLQMIALPTLKRPMNVTRLAEVNSSTLNITSLRRVASGFPSASPTQEDPSATVALADPERKLNNKMISFRSQEAVSPDENDMHRKTSGVSDQGGSEHKEFPTTPTAAVINACEGRQHLEFTFPTSSNWTIVMATNNGFLDFFENWWNHYDLLNIDANIIVMAEDKQAYRRLLNMSLPRVFVVQTNHEDVNPNLQQPTILRTSSNNETEEIDFAENEEELVDELEYDLYHQYGSPWYKTLVSTRPARLLSVLCSPQLATQNLIYADVDSVWKKDPIPHVQNHLFYDSGVRSKNGNTTIIDSSSERRGGGELDIVAQMDNPNTAPVGYCTGFLAMRNNERVRQFLVYWEQAIEQKAEEDNLMDAGDQPVFVEVIHNAKIAEELGIRHGSLPMRLFPPGGIYFDTETTDKERDEAVVVHNNWIAGHHNKKIRFYLWDLWKGKESTLQKNNALSVLTVMRMMSKHKERRRQQEEEEEEEERIKNGTSTSNQHMIATAEDTLSVVARDHSMQNKTPCCWPKRVTKDLEPFKETQTRS